MTTVSTGRRLTYVDGYFIWLGGYHDREIAKQQRCFPVCRAKFCRSVATETLGGSTPVLCAKCLKRAAARLVSGKGP